MFSVGFITIDIYESIFIYFYFQKKVENIFYPPRLLRKIKSKDSRHDAYLYFLYFFIKFDVVMLIYCKISKNFQMEDLTKFVQHITRFFTSAML